MTGPIKVTHIEIDEETQSARIKLTEESLELIRKMFPGMTDQEAVNAYWNAATAHLQTSENLKVDVIDTEESK